jgi:MYCBP-associated protein family
MRATVQGVEQSSHPQAVFMMQQSGCILPGEQSPFRFLFRPPHAGIFVEKWSMRTGPDLLPDFPAPEVTVRGIAHARDYSVLQQRMLSKALDATQKARTVDAVLNRVLTNANTQAKVLETKLSPDLMQAHDEFLRATFDLEPPIFYSPSTNGELQSVYSEVKAALNKPEKPLKKGEQLDAPMPDIFHADPRQLQSWLEQVSRLDSTAAM